MPLPQGPLPAGTRISRPVEVEVVRDDGDTLEVLIPNGDGTRSVRVLERLFLQGGEVVGG